MAARLNQPIAEIDIKAQLATRSGAHAEELAATRKTARLRRDEIRRRDEAVRTAERTADALQQEVAQLRSTLEEQQRRELAERCRIGKRSIA